MNVIIFTTIWSKKESVNGKAISANCHANHNSSNKNKLDETTFSSFAHRKNSHFETMMKAILLVFAIARAVPIGVHISAV
uniref:Uncharacterized protein n=1 Tax=Globodera rostochiensis TaxID=31243 RepID=A0A914HTC9_GLORO